VAAPLESTRRWGREHPYAVDGLFAAVAIGVALLSQNGVIEAFRAQEPWNSGDELAAFVGVALTCAPIALRRRAPLAGLVLTTAAFIAARQLLGSNESTVTAAALSVAVYSAGAHGRAPWWRLWCSLATLVFTIEVTTEIGLGGPNALYKLFVVVYNLSLFAASGVLGAAVRSSRERRDRLEERTTQLEVEREENARRAVVAERLRIARELHDVVAHHVSVIGVQAGAARTVMDRDPLAARTALEAIEGESRQAVDEMHRLLSVLRGADDDPHDLLPAPGLDQLGELTAAAAQAGVAVDVQIEGEARPLTPTVELSAYRIVQEALTNTIKHSGASQARVVLRYRSGDLELEITDDGAGAEPGGGATTGGGAATAVRATPAATATRRAIAAAPTRGLGLVGMRERVGFHGGTLTTGAAPDGGGFVVRATLPTTSSTRTPA
jgi:signal transduction histidine kinase